MIRECLVLTRSAQGVSHLIPMGLQTLTLSDGADGVLLQPFRPSTTLDNLLASGCATVNHVDDVRLFAGCLTGRRTWPSVPAAAIPCERLANALTHLELTVEGMVDDPVRPEIHLRVLRTEHHAPFPGFNRAKAAVIEAAVLISRLERLPAEKVDRELEYLAIAIDKTAGDEEREAWQWLLHAVGRFRRGDPDWRLP
jgi:hypothetical protein